MASVQMSPTGTPKTRRSSAPGKPRSGGSLSALDGNVENRGFPAAQQRRSSDLAIQTPTPGLGEAEKEATQMRRLTSGKIEALKERGIDPHDLKPKKGGGKYDLFKDTDGNIYVKPKDGSGLGEPTGINVGDGT